MTRKLLTLALPALFAASLSGGCASTYTLESCSQTDWSQIGYAAGLDGRSPSTRAREKCGEFGVVADVVAIDAGWQDGVANFCTPLRVLEVGLKRDPDLGVCGARDRELEEVAALATSHRRIALRFHGAESRLSSARGTIRSSRRKIDKHRIRIAGWERDLTTAPEAGRAEIRYAIVKFEDKIEKHNRRIREARRDIRHAESDLAYALPAYERSRAEVEAVRWALRR